MAAFINKDKDALKRYSLLCSTISESNEINPFETKNGQLDRVNKAKKDFKRFVETYFKHYSDAETPEFHIKLARKVRRNGKYKGWLKWARGHAKSVVAIVLLPLWLWINDDIKFILVVGQNETKATTLLGDLQAEFEHNKLLIHDFGAQKVTGSWESGFFTTVSGFKAKAIGMGQDPRGIRVVADRPDYIAADDWETKETLKNPKRQDEYSKWFLTGVIPAMDNKNRRVLICQNHFAPRMIFSKIVEENKYWDVDQVNGYDPVTYAPTWYQKYTAQFWREVELEIGTINAMAEYNHQPHTEGKLFTDKMIQWADLPRLKTFTAFTGRWDVAYGGNSKSDYNAIRIWGLHDGKKYLIDCFVKQSKLKVAVQWIADFQKNLPIGISIQIGFESQFWNDSVTETIQEVQDEQEINLNLIKIDSSKTNKYDRMIEMLPQYEQGKIYYNNKLKAHNDTQVGLEQLKGIEPGYKTHDDAPDADKYAFDYLDSFKASLQTKARFNKRESRKF